MSRQRPPAIGDDARVVPFAPRGKRRAVQPPRGCGPCDLDDYDSVVPGLQAYERCESGDDFRHRMTMNCIAFAVDLLLIIIGVWLADQMASSGSGRMAEPTMSFAPRDEDAERLLQRNQLLKEPFTQAGAWQCCRREGR